MEYIEQIRELFYSNNIELAIQLIKGQGYDLRDVLHELYYTYRVNDEDNWNRSYYFELICLDIEIYQASYLRSNYRLWLYGNPIDCNDIDEGLDFIYKYLINEYK